MVKNKLEQLKEEYRDIPIPSELDRVVENTLQNSKPKSYRLRLFGGIAAAAIIFITSLNVSPAFAKSLEGIPFVGSIVEVLTVREYSVDEGNYQADIKVPAVDNLENESLEESLNSKYIEEGQALYEAFMDEMETQKVFSGSGHIRVDSDFVVKTETDQLLSIGRYVVETMASSYTTIQYDTIDKQNKVLVTLPSLFKDNSYIEVISENIKKQMKQQMEEDPSKIYFIEPSDEIMSKDIFTTIAKDQNFYINADNQLVISFNDYEVAPGYMGTVEFVITTEEIQNILISNEYIK